MAGNVSKRLSKLIVGIFFLAFTGNASAQATLQIIANDGTPLPYATVANFTKKKVYSADSAGVLKIEIDLQDSVQVSYTGFSLVSYRYSGVKYAVITLDKNPSLLELVVIKDCSRKVKLTIKNFQKKEFLRRDTTFYWSFADDKAKYAVKINSPDPRSVLKKFSFWIEKVFDAPDSTAYAPFMITFYEVNDTSGLPGAALPVKPIVYFPKRTGRQNLQLDSLHFTIPENGMYISFQYILNKKFAWSYSAKLHCSTCPDVPVTGYGAMLKFIKGTNDASAEYGIFSNHWSAMRRNMAIQLEATVSYCKEE